MSARSANPSAATECAAIVRDAVEPGEPLKVSLHRLAALFGMKPRRVRQYLYGEVRLVPAEEADALRAAHARVLRQRAAKLDAELVTLRARLAVMDQPKGG